MSIKDTKRNYGSNNYLQIVANIPSAKKRLEEIKKDLNNKNKRV